MTLAPADTAARLDGARLFVRYAYPPNERGSCGPDDHRTLFAYGSTGTSDAGLREIAAQFTGAWPYLELLAREAGIGDPLDRRVVEAYWIGNGLLDRIDRTGFARSLDERFRRRTGVSWGNVLGAFEAGGVPHHAFHVFAVYPWVGLLSADRGPDPLFILDRCRIRWGRVLAVVADEVVVESRPLVWDGTRLSLGDHVRESATIGIDGVGLGVAVEPGDWVSLHWRWVCDRLTGRQLRSLRDHTVRQLGITNDALGRPGDLLE